MRSAIFADRDGTLIPDLEFPRDPDQVRLLPGVGNALQALQGAGYILVIISNQSGVGRGLLKLEEVMAVHERLVELLNAKGVRLEGYYYCAHSPWAGCECRKPSPAMILRAATDLDIDLASSFLVGDKDIDIQAGKDAGCRTILLRATESQGDECEPDHRVVDWAEILELLTEATR